MPDLHGQNQYPRAERAAGFSAFRANRRIRAFWKGAADFRIFPARYRGFALPKNAHDRAIPLARTRRAVFEAVRRQNNRLSRAHFQRSDRRGRTCPRNPKTLSLLYVAPIITLLGVCDRRSEHEEECLVRLENHVRLFFHRDFLIFFSAQNRKHVILVMYPRTLFVFLMFLP